MRTATEIGQDKIWHVVKLEVAWIKVSIFANEFELNRKVIR